MPGVEAIVDGKIDDLRGEMHDGFSVMRNEMKAGFSDMKKSFQVLGGTVAELVENTKEQKHEERIKFLERKAGVR